VLSAACCVGFVAAGGRDERGVAMGLFTVYFLLHDLRDESWFYAANGDVSADESRRIGRATTAFVLCLLVATLAGGIALGFPKRPLRVLAVDAWPAVVRIGGPALVALAAVVGAHYAAGEIAKGVPGGRVGAMKKHRPLWLALLGVYAVFFGSIAMTGRFY